MTDFTAETEALHCQPAETLRQERTSIKWAGCQSGVLPMFIAEMDFTVDERIREALIAQIERSDLGYSGDLSGLVGAFADFAADRWAWQPEREFFYGAPDVSFGVKAVLRHLLPEGARVALATPSYPSFFGYLTELGVECVEIPLAGSGETLHLDTDAIDRAFGASGADRVHAMVLSNPHNPHGIAHSAADLEALAASAARHGAIVIADEIHAPLVHHGVTFTPFAPIAAAAGTTSVTVTSASKGWNIAGTKCALIYAPPATSPDSLREYLTVALSGSTSILGRTASQVAFADCRDWLDRAITQVSSNGRLLAELLAEHVPGARYTPPKTSYLAWIDLSDAGLGPTPALTLLEKADLIVSDGATFGANGHGCIRLNLGCSEEVLREAVARMGRAAAPAAAPAGLPR